MTLVIFIDVITGDGGGCLDTQQICRTFCVQLLCITSYFCSLAIHTNVRKMPLKKRKIYHVFGQPPPPKYTLHLQIHYAARISVIDLKVN